MDQSAGNHIGSGMAWLGFWIMLGLFVHGEDEITYRLECDKDEKFVMPSWTQPDNSVESITE